MVHIPRVEVETSVKRRSEHLHFEAADVIERIEKLGDLFASVLSLKQRLPRSLREPLKSGAPLCRFRIG